MAPKCVCGLSLPKRDKTLLYSCKCGQVWVSAEKLILFLVNQELANGN